MGKSLSTITRLFNISENLKPTKQAKPTSGIQRVGGEKLKKMGSSAADMDNVMNNNCNWDSSNSTSVTRLPLSEVVSDCVKRWFKDTLKEAKAGDINMQVLVGQMYYSGYGVPRDAQKVCAPSFYYFFLTPNLRDWGCRVFKGLLIDVLCCFLLLLEGNKRAQKKKKSV